MGEIRLLETILENENLHKLVMIALDKGFRISELKDYPVMKDGGWVSTQESTVSCPIIYLSKDSNGFVILKRPEDKEYKLSDYTTIL